MNNLNNNLFAQGYFHQQTTPNQHSHSPAQHPPGIAVPSYAQPSNHYGTGEIHVDPHNPLAAVTGTPQNGLHDQHGGGGPSDDGDDDGVMDTPGGSKAKKGGRPRDKVWELFDGDRSVARCRYCSWKTDHPKAFRMRTHVAACDMIPQEKKDEQVHHQEEKEQRKLIKQQHFAEEQQLSGNNGGVTALVVGPSSGPAAPKKSKRDHSGEILVGPSSSTPRRMPPARPPQSPITCHVLDSTSGKPAPDMRIRLDRLNTTGFVLQSQGVTDNDGRCSTLLPPGTVLEVGIFKITFFTSEYFTKRGILSFYPFVEIPFEVKSAEEHYHIPCLLSPYSYTTYRGS